MPRRAVVIRHLAKEELEKRYGEEKNPRSRERLLAMLHLYDGKSITDTASMIRRDHRSVERWLKGWNEQGYEGLIPHFDGGPNPRMQQSEWEKVVKEIEGKGLTIRDVKVYVKNTRGIEYSYYGVWKMLRRKIKVRYGKPYSRNRKRPENAEEILKKGLRLR